MQHHVRLRRPAARITLASAALLALGLAAPAALGRSLEKAQPAADALDPLGDEVPRPRKLGLMFDLGSLDGGMLSLVYRPIPWLRVYGGGGTNGAAPGLRLGSSITPFHDPHWAFNLDGGHFFPGDVNGIFSAFAGAGYDHTRALENFDYSFVNLQGGWEVEAAGLLFFVRGGVGYVWTQLPEQDIARLRHPSPLVSADGSVRAFLPSLRIGFIGFF